MDLDSDLSQSDTDFGFAFNNVNFSDRLLRIEIIRCRGDVSCSSVADYVRDRKRRRHSLDSENDNKKHEESDQVSHSGEDETEYDCKLTRVQELHISSLILAAKSPFFYKMFSNGMLESEQNHLTLKLDASEEAAVMELLHFMYSNRLSVTTVPALLDVLMAADKFEVTSCMKFCCRLLLDMPMALDFALLVLQLPSTLLMADPVHPLTNAATHFLASHYKDISKFPLDEVMALPLVGMETILANDDLQIPYEDLLYEVVLKWVKLHYPVLQDRQDILGSHLSRFIRFPYISRRKLKQILTSNDFKPSVASKLVLEALFHKLESVHDQAVSKRDYNYKPIKVVEFEVPRHQCIVYLDLNRKECVSLYPSGRVCSQGFHLGGQWFSLTAHCNMAELSVFHCFGLFLAMQERGPVNLTVDYEFSARSKPTEEFVRRYKGKYQFTGGKAIGYRNLFGITWDSFIAKDCPHFINDVLYLRADLSIRR